MNATKKARTRRNRPEMEQLLGALYDLEDAARRCQGGDPEPLLPGDVEALLFQLDVFRVRLESGLLPSPRMEKRRRS